MEEVAREFSIDGDIRAIERIGVGHIHHSFKVVTSTTSYFLQRINHRIFDPHILDRNLTTILPYLQGSDKVYETLQPVKTTGNDTVLIKDGRYFRMFLFKKDMVSHDAPKSLSLIYEGAKAFGAFARLLKPLKVGNVHEILPGFHSLNGRLKQLEESSKNCEEFLLSETAQEFAIISKYSTECLEIEKAWKSGKIPTRVVHNDTKFNNLLFDQKEKARCVVDLDTVMPGIIHFDLGDGLRTTSTMAMEDEKNLEKVIIDRERYDSFFEGYLDGLSESFTGEDQQLLSISGMYMAMIMGIRFLTDFLDGNKYYQVQYPDHNLDRARCQLHLARSFHDLNKN